MCGGQTLESQNGRETDCGDKDSRDSGKPHCQRDSGRTPSGLSQAPKAETGEGKTLIRWEAGLKAASNSRQALTSTSYKEEAMAEKILASSELQQLRLILLELVHESRQKHAFEGGKTEAYGHVLEIVNERLKKLGITGMPEDWDIRR